MSFTKANPGGWGTGDVFTSAQVNQLDTDHANSLDKTSAGDTLSGVVTTTGAGSIHAATAGGVEATVAGGITATAAAGIESGVASGIALTGGASDWPTFGASGGSPRTRTLVVPGDEVLGISTATVASGGGAPQFTTSSANAPLIQSSGGFLTAVANSANNNTYAYYFPIRKLHNGATLTSATLYLNGASGHAALPQTMPAFGVFRVSVTNPAGSVSLNSSVNYTNDGSGTLAAYKAIHSFAFGCNQDNVIDTSQYAYFAIVWDEGGTNAVAGNAYYGIALAYGSITDMRFP